ncbi:MAG: hypothetical protein ACLR43_01970 [Faecalibacillus faecis]
MDKVAEEIGNMVLFNSQYQMLTGWQRINGKWYYLSTVLWKYMGKLIMKVIWLLDASIRE